MGLPTKIIGQIPKRGIVAKICKTVLKEKAGIILQKSWGPHRNRQVIGLATQRLYEYNHEKDTG